MSITVRPALEHDAKALAALINEAYEVERFFVSGDRTDAEDVRAHMRKGRVLVAADDAGPPVGCVYVETIGEGGTFGMLAVHPSRQGTGLGGRLIGAAEEYVRAAGGRFMEILVVNVRADLLPRYGRLGYAAVGTAPYVHRPTTQSVHFIVMRKALG